MHKKDTTEVVLGICWVNVHHVHDDQGSHDALTDLISCVQSTLSFVATIAVCTQHVQDDTFLLACQVSKQLSLNTSGPGTLGILREHF